MANFMGSTFENTPVQSSINLPLIQQVLAVKQGTYDANKAKIDQTLQAFGNLDLVRDIDKQYLATKIDEVNGFLANSGNRDLSLSYNADDIIGRVRNIAQDPIIQSAMENTQKLRGFQKGVEELKKKDPNKFNNANYNDALELGGYGEWFKGDTNALGNLQYNEYVNVNENLHKRAQDYAKLMDREQILRSDNKGYYIEDVKGKRLSMEDIYSQLESTLDEKEKTQLDINARQSIGKYSEADFNKYISSNLSSEVNSTKLQVAKLKAEMKTADKEEQVQYQQLIKQLEDGVSVKESKLSSNKFDRNDMYSVYKKDFLKDIAGNYDFSIITDIERDDLPLQIMKFDFDKYKHEVDTALKIRDIESKEKANKLTEQSMYGGATVVDKPIDLKGEDSDIDKISKATYRAADALDKYLLSINEPGYKDMSDNEKFQYRINLNADDPSKTGNNAQRQNLINDFQDAQRSYASIINNNTDKWTDNIKSAYNSITGANVDNLSRTMPYTASLLKGGLKDFSKLNKEAQQGVVAEMTANWLQFGETDDVNRGILTKTLQSTQAKLENSGTSYSKKVLGSISESLKNTQELPGFTSGAIQELYYTGKAMLGRTSPFLSNLAISGDYQLEKLQRTLGRNVPFRQDTNITEIDKYTGDASIDFQSHFRKASNELKQNTQSLSSSYMPNLKTGKALAFSSEDKVQKTTALQIRQAIVANENNPIPSDKNDYILSREGTSYKVTYSVGSGDKKEQTSIYLEKLPQEVESRMDTSQANWNRSLMNPNVKLPSFTFKPTISQKEAFDNFDTVSQNRPDIIPTDVWTNIVNRRSTAGTEFQTIKEFKEQIDKDKLKQFEPQIDEILGATYRTSSQLRNGTLVGFIQGTSQDGRIVAEMVIPLNNINEVDPQKMNFEFLRNIKLLKEQEIKKIVD